MKPMQLTLAGVLVLAVNSASAGPEGKTGPSDKHYEEQVRPLLPGTAAPAMVMPSCCCSMVFD